jgi:PadR family transcriptional regulator, regulatory protein PadR
MPTPQRAGELLTEYGGPQRRSEAIRTKLHAGMPPPEEKHHDSSRERDLRFSEIEARPKNCLKPVILVSLRQWNFYGYEMLERLTQFGYEAMNPGTLYRTLRRMEENGHVKSEWETSKGGPARRKYYVTEAGERYLDLWVEGIKQYQQAVNAFFRLYTGGRP